MSSAETRRDAPASRFLAPEVLARIGNIELLARTVVEGFVTGLHKSPYLGRSVDFAEHRAAGNFRPEWQPKRTDEIELPAVAVGRPEPYSE